MLTAIFVFFSLMGGYIWFCVGDSSKKPAEKSLEEQAFIKVLEEIDNAPAAKKPILALQLYKNKDWRVYAYTFYDGNAEFRKLTNRGIRLLFLVDFEEGIEFCSQHTSSIFGAQFSACEYRKR